MDLEKMAFKIGDRVMRIEIGHSYEKDGSLIVHEPDGTIDTITGFKRHDCLQFENSGSYGWSARYYKLIENTDVIKIERKSIKLFE